MHDPSLLESCEEMDKIRRNMTAVIVFCTSLYAQTQTKTISNAQKTHHIIQLVTIHAELKQPELPRMYCSRYLEGYWVAQEVTVLKKPSFLLSLELQRINSCTSIYI